MVEQNLLSGERSISSTSRGYDSAKRIFDLLAASLLILALSPILLLVAVWVRLDSKGPVFFRQPRVGKDGNTFKIIKFRTMVMNAESIGPLVTSRNDPRMTRSGSVLRAWKLDELPQLFNVVLGEMSLVGPRPQVSKYVDRFPEPQRTKILSVRPGITGPTAIKFRHEEEMLQNRANREQFYIDVLLPIKCNLDEDYVDQRGPVADLRALSQTAAMLVRGVFYRLRRIPVGDTIEYPLPDESAGTSSAATPSFAVADFSNLVRADEDDGMVGSAVRD